MKEERLAKICIAHDLVVFAPEGHPFPGRNGAGPSEAIVDLRGAASNLLLRGVILGALAHEVLSFPTAIIGGVSRGGVVFGSMLALLFSREFVVVLPEGPRQSGLQRAVEGNVRGRDVVLFDNVVTSGDSLIKASNYVTAAGGKVIGAVVFAAYGRSRRFAFRFRTVLHFRQLIDAAHEAGVIDEARRNRILKVRK